MISDSLMVYLESFPKQKESELMAWYICKNNKMYPIRQKLHKIGINI